MKIVLVEAYVDLTVRFFFTHLIFHPEDARKEDYHKCLCTSVALGIITLGILPLAVGVSWMVKHTYVWITGQLSGKEEKINGVKETILSKDRSCPGIVNKRSITIDETDVSIIKHSSLRVLPAGSINWKNDFMHVDILNQRGYRINGKMVKLREPVIPEKIERNLKVSFANQISLLKIQLVGFAVKAPKIHIKDETTDQAIYNGKQHKIALNFANEKHAGGGPGIYKDLESNQIKWGGTLSAQAQEEALVNKSDLYSSLTLLPTRPEKKLGDTMIRNYYENGGFDSRTTVYTSDNQLFGIRTGDFYTTQFLVTPRDVSFVTSAAACYGSKTKVAVDCDSAVYKDATERIRTHLYAAAKKR